MKKTLCLLLAVAVMVCFVPSMAFASESTSNGPTNSTVVSPDASGGGGNTTTPPATNPDTSGGGGSTTTPPATNPDTSGGGGSTTTPGGGTSTPSIGGGGTATPPEVVKNTEGTTTADVTTTVKDDKVVIVIDEKTADKIVEKAIENKSKNIVINAVTNKENIKAAEVSVPADAVKNIAEKTDAAVIIKTDVGEKELDKAAVAAVAQQAQSGDIKFIISTVQKDNNKIVLELSIITATGAVKDFNGGKAKVTVKLSNELKTNNPLCVYVDAEGLYHKVEGQLNENGTYTFVTTHFSQFAVMASKEADKTIAEQKAKVKATTIALKSKKGKGYVRLNWTAKGDYSLDGYEVFRVKANLYKAKPAIKKKWGSTAKTTYKNAKGLKKGKYYHYKVRGYKLVDGAKVYTKWSNRVFKKAI